MTKEEAAKAFVEGRIEYLPITKEFFEHVKLVASQCNIEVLDEYWHNDNFVIVKIKIKKMYSIFQLGAFVQIERQMGEQKQKMIDDIFREGNQLS